jgi:DNA-binding FadR family transcriptional regulator
MNFKPGAGRVTKPPKLADIVARDLRARIVRGALRQGDQLPTLDRLARRFGVSLAVVREALRILETEGLLEIRRGAKGGVAVKAPTLDVVSRSVGVFLQHQKVTLEDLLNARLGMEPFAAGRLAARPTPAVIAALEALIAEGERSLDDPLAFAQIAAAFHQAVVALAGNKTLSVVHAAIVNIVEAELTSLPDRGKSSASTESQRRKSLNSYRRLTNLVKAADVPGAERHWARHLENQAKVLLNLDPDMLIIDLFAPRPDALSAASPTEPW